MSGVSKEQQRGETVSRVEVKYQEMRSNSKQGSGVRLVRLPWHSHGVGLFSKGNVKFFLGLLQKDTIHFDRFSKIVCG